MRQNITLNCVRIFASLADFAEPQHVTAGPWEQQTSAAALYVFPLQHARFPLSEKKGKRDGVEPQHSSTTAAWPSPWPDALHWVAGSKPFFMLID